MKTLPYLFLSLVFGNASERVIFPILALVFFDIHSHLLPVDSSHAIRSYWYGLCVALPSISTFIAAPILSCLSDFYGRRIILMFSFLGSALSGVITSVAILNQQIILFAFGMFIQGLFCRTNPVAQAVVGDISCSSNKLLNIGRVQTFIAFGAFLGPIIGGYFARWHFEHFNFAVPFFFSAAFGLGAFLVCYFYFSETLRVPVKQLSGALIFGSLRVLKHRPTFLLAAVLFCEQFTWSLYYQYVPPILKLLSEFSSTSLGFFVGLMALWVMLGGAVVIRLLKIKLNELQILATALAFQLIGSLSVIVAVEHNIVWMIWGSSIPAAVGDVMAFSVISTLYSNAFGSGQQGQVMGACFFIAAAVWSITALLGGYLLALNGLLPLLISPVAVVIALLLQRTLGKEFSP